MMEMYFSDFFFSKGNKLQTNHDKSWDFDQKI